MNMNISGINAYQYGGSSKKNEVSKETKAADIQKKGIGADISAKNESKLSAKAQNYLNSLREKYGDYDFMIGNSTDDLKELSASGTKEFSVILSNEELERMANDEKYAQEKMQSVEGAVKMSKRICEEYGFTSAFGREAGENGIINKISVVIDDKGGMKIFAALEKLSENQRERMEKNKDKQTEDKKKQENALKNNPYAKEDKATVKKTIVEASSPEELLEEIGKIDWDKISKKESKAGERINFIV